MKPRRLLPGCSGKVRYHTRAEAKAAQKALKKLARAPVSIYRCTHCGFCHLGTYVDAEGLSMIRSKRRLILGKQTDPWGR